MCLVEKRMYVWSEKQSRRPQHSPTDNNNDNNKPTGIAQGDREQANKLGQLTRGRSGGPESVHGSTMRERRSMLVILKRVESPNE